MNSVSISLVLHTVHSEKEEEEEKKTVGKDRSTFLMFLFLTLFCFLEEVHGEKGKMSR